jgi:hypothetical protein
VRSVQAPHVANGEQALQVPQPSVQLPQVSVQALQVGHPSEQTPQLASSVQAVQTQSVLSPVSSLSPPSSPFPPQDT